jgi:transcription antitermination factor NusA-like protein
MTMFDIDQRKHLSVRATHIVVSRGRFARAIRTQDHNVRLAIWLAGWHIEIYDEPGDHPARVGRDIASA